jgi:hypothetical protein
MQAGENPAAAAPIGATMIGIPRRYSHFVFGVIQAGLTSPIFCLTGFCPG